jgi:uncharacterized protein YydD (DUF2326 family)
MIEKTFKFTDEEWKKMKKAKDHTGYRSMREYIIRKCSNGYSIKRELKR